MQIAQLIKANVGLQVAFVDVSGGWDTHAGEAERLPGLLTGFGQALGAFHRDLGDRMEDVVVLHDVGVRTDGARERERRHRSRPRQLHVRLRAARSRAARSTGSGRAWRRSSSTRIAISR